MILKLKFKTNMLRFLILETKRDIIYSLEIQNVTYPKYNKIES